jgi:hypothetical protein
MRPFWVAILPRANRAIVRFTKAVQVDAVIASRAPLILLIRNLPPESDTFIPITHCFFLLQRQRLLSESARSSEEDTTIMVSKHRLRKGESGRGV